MTSVPPFKRKVLDIVEEHRRFKALVKRQAYPLAPLYGLQNPPESSNASTWKLLQGEGISISTIAFEVENEYGGGFAVPDAPLTGEGLQTLWAMAQAGMTLDLSHAGHRTMRDALEEIEARDLRLPVVVTHSACFEVYPHLRNVPDDVLRMVRARRGIFGLATFSWMLAEEGNELSAFFRHLEHALSVMGEDGVCLGSDGVYAHIDPVEGEKRFALMNEKLDPRGNYRARWPERAEELNTARFAEILCEGMERQFGARIAQKVAGQNLLSFLCSR